MRLTYRQISTTSLTTAASRPSVPLPEAYGRIAGDCCLRPPKAGPGRLGHSSIVVTLDHYAHLFPEIDEVLAQRLEDNFGDLLAPVRALKRSRTPQQVSHSMRNVDLANDSVGADDEIRTSDPHLG
jgi:hypothetical protein